MGKLFKQAVKPSTEGIVATDEMYGIIDRIIKLPEMQDKAPIDLARTAMYVWKKGKQEQYKKELEWYSANGTMNPDFKPKIDGRDMLSLAKKVLREKGIPESNWPAVPWFIFSPQKDIFNLTPNLVDYITNHDVRSKERKLTEQDFAKKHKWSPGVKNPAPAPAPGLSTQRPPAPVPEPDPRVPMHQPVQAWIAKHCKFAKGR